jgi:hypothetical protein
VVNCGRYHIAGDNFVHTSHETILTTGIASFMVKTMKQELKVDDTFPQFFNALASFTFIELFDSFTSEDLTPLLSLIKSSKGIC